MKKPIHRHLTDGLTSSFDHGTKSTNTTGSHSHGGVLSRDDPWEIGGNNWTRVNLQNLANTDAAGDHAHTLAIGAHAHNVSGTTANTGSGTALSVTNSFVKLMGWYRSA